MDDNYSVMERNNDYDVVELVPAKGGISVKQGAAMAAGGALLGAAIMVGVKKLFWDPNTKKQIDAQTAEFDKKFEEYKTEQDKLIAALVKFLEEAGVNIDISEIKEK